MQTRLASRFATGLALGALAMGLSVAAPSASAQALTATVPFAFESGSQHFTAGKYQVAMESSHIVALRNVDTKEGGMLFTIPEQAGAPSAKGRLVFQRYGHHYFLRQVWSPGTSLGRTLAKSRAEREAQVLTAHETQGQPQVTVALVHLPW